MAKFTLEKLQQLADEVYLITEGNNFTRDDYERMISVLELIQKRIENNKDDYEKPGEMVNSCLYMILLINLKITAILENEYYRKAQ